MENYRITLGCIVVAIMISLIFISNDIMNIVFQVLGGIMYILLTVALFLIITTE